MARCTTILIHPISEDSNLVSSQKTIKITQISSISMRVSIMQNPSHYFTLMFD